METNQSINYQPTAGDMIQKVADIIIDMAKNSNVSVETEVNGISLIATPNSDSEEIIADYYVGIRYREMDEIELHLFNGSSLYKVAFSLVRESNNNKKTAFGRFNGVSFLANPGDDISNVVNFYSAQLEKQECTVKTNNPVVYERLNGDSLEQRVDRIVAMAKDFGKAVRTVYNGIILLANLNSEPKEILIDYYAQMYQSERNDLNELGLSDCTSIHKFASKLVEEANDYARPAAGKFNNISLLARPGAWPSDIVDYYDAKLDKINQKAEKK